MIASGCPRVRYVGGHQIATLHLAAAAVHPQMFSGDTLEHHTLAVSVWLFECPMLTVKRLKA